MGAENVGNLLRYEEIGGPMRRIVGSSGFVFVALISNTRGPLRTMLGHLGMVMLHTPWTCVRLKEKILIMMMKKMKMEVLGPFVFNN